MSNRMVVNQDIRALAADVNALLAQGYVPAGGVLYRNSEWIQPMITGQSQVPYGVAMAQTDLDFNAQCEALATDGSQPLDAAKYINGFFVQAYGDAPAAGGDTPSDAYFKAIDIKGQGETGVMVTGSSPYGFVVEGAPGTNGAVITAYTPDLGGTVKGQVAWTTQGLQVTHSAQNKPVVERTGTSVILAYGNGATNGATLTLTNTAWQAAVTGSATFTPTLGFTVTIGTRSPFAATQSAITMNRPGGNATPQVDITSTYTAVRFLSTVDTQQGQLYMSSGGVSISSQNGIAFQVYTTLTGLGRPSLPTYLDGSGVLPMTDSAIPLGGANNRWSQVFAATGTINTSDADAKELIGKIEDEILDAWADVEWQTFKYKDAIELKEGGARWHFGLIAQRVRDAFIAHDLDPFAYGLLCLDEWDAQPALTHTEYDPESEKDVEVIDYPATPAGQRFGIRYDEALALECALMRRELRRLKDGGN